MAKIYKPGDPLRHQITAVCRGELEEFPEAKRVALELPRYEEEALPEDEESTEEAAEYFDPEEIRQAVLAEAKAEAEAKVKEAYAEGLRRGEEAGRAEFEATIAHAAEALEAAAEEMKAARDAFLESLEPQVVALSTLIAERVLHRELQSDPNLVQHSVRRALEVIADRQTLHVLVHPDDLEAMRAHQADLLESFPGIGELTLDADESVTPGGCVVESKEVQADMTLETLLASVLNAMRE